MDYGIICDVPQEQVASFRLLISLGRGWHTGHCTTPKKPSGRDLLQMMNSQPLKIHRFLSGEFSLDGSWFPTFFNNWLHEKQVDHRTNHEPPGWFFTLHGELWPLGKSQMWHIWHAAGVFAAPEVNLRACQGNQRVVASEASSSCACGCWAPTLPSCLSSGALLPGLFTHWSHGIFPKTSSATGVITWT